MNTKLQEALSYDPISEAEEILGTREKSDAVAITGMLLMMQHNDYKAGLLEGNNDTNAFRQSREQWTAVIESMGFKLILEEQIEGTADKLRVWWCDGVLLVSDSYGGDKSVNGAKAYLNYHGDRSELPRCSNGFIYDIDGVPSWHVSLDAREGFRLNLDKMRSNGLILPSWIKRPFLWLLSYMDSKADGYDYKAINAERISRLPKHVQQAIGSGD